MLIHQNLHFLDQSINKCIVETHRSPNGLVVQKYIIIFELPHQLSHIPTGHTACLLILNTFQYFLDCALQLEPLPRLLHIPPVVLQYHLHLFNQNLNRLFLLLKCLHIRGGEREVDQELNRLFDQAPLPDGVVDMAG